MADVMKISSIPQLFEFDGQIKALRTYGVEGVLDILKPDLNHEPTPHRIINGILAIKDEHIYNYRYGVGVIVSQVLRSQILISTRVDHDQAFQIMAAFRHYGYKDDVTDDFGVIESNFVEQYTTASLLTVVYQRLNYDDSIIKVKGNTIFIDGVTFDLCGRELK